MHISVKHILSKGENSQKKTYSDYNIQISYNNNILKWNVKRSFKNFCDLHQLLIKDFSKKISFPASSNFINNSTTDFNTINNSKRSIFIEERRKNLQQYLRDLIAFEIIRKFKIFQNFLELNRINPDYSQKSRFSIESNIFNQENTLEEAKTPFDKTKNFLFFEKDDKFFNRY